MARLFRLWAKRERRKTGVSKEVRERARKIRATMARIRRTSILLKKEILATSKRIRSERPKR